MTQSVLQFLEPRRPELGPRTVSGQSAHWRFGEDGNGIGWLVLDKRGSDTNTLSADVLREFENHVDAIEQSDLRGLVLRSAKPSGFAVGADINDFAKLGEPDEIEKTVREAHSVVNRLESLELPTVAILHGKCLGGGLELALACDYRIAVSGAALGLPEIRIGLHPGLGGTARATHLINPLQAMTLMLTGKSIDSQRARSLGLVDAVVEERHAAAAVRAVMSGELKSGGRAFKNAALRSKAGRRIAARRMRSETNKRAPRRHYPAPHTLIELWEEHGGDRKTMMESEVASFARLLVSDTAKNLIRVFLLRQRMKRAGAGDCGVGHVHVVGAGEMGGDIAGWCARSGFSVSLSDSKTKAIAGAVRRLADLCADEKLDQIGTRATLDRLVPDPDAVGVPRADIVIEAVPEDLEMKRQVFREIEPRLKDGALLATNTSSIPLDKLAETLERPSRLVGLHFFNPVAKMQLVEVVRHEAADRKILEVARNFVGRIDRLPVAVNGTPGFLVNRALMPYLTEALILLDEGVKAETVDWCAESFGMPMGPVELADRVGLDIGLSVADMLRNDLDGRVPDLPKWFKDKVAEGNLGMKSGSGLYKWTDGKPKKSRNVASPGRDLADRLILPMLNACVACLREGTIDDEDLLDGAMIFGTGFAPFRGGPLAYARARGIENITLALETLADQHGKRFAPDPGWSRFG